MVKNMKVNTQIMGYLNSKYDKEKIILILRENNLFGQLGDLFITFNDNDLKELKKKKIGVKYLENILRKLCILMDKNKIRYCTFKGVILANRLYGDNNCRQLNDIDVFVHQQDFDKALEIFQKEGAVLVSKAELKNPHHAVLVIQHVFIELHRNVLSPLIGIIENYLHNNIDYFRLLDYNFKTFSITATLLHLLYHLYMDTYSATGSLYNIFANKSISKAGRFLYRAYEIALFSEKYYNQIKWEDIIEDIKKQKLRIIFKKMIMDILEIFPEAFPQSFLHTVYNLNYVNNERDYLYKYFNESNMNNSNNFDVLLIDYINNNWDSRRENNIHKKVGENISLVKKSSNEIYKDLSCDIITEKTIEGLKIVFRVSNDDFYISDSGDYNTQTSDGVHLLLCGTEQYSYNSIFLFPKEIDGEINVVVCDVLNSANKVLDDNLIKADFSKTENDYTITAILSNKFLKENYLTSYLYMGLVISDCSSETHHRKNELILSEKSSEWYNPIYFAKICMK